MRKNIGSKRMTVPMGLGWNCGNLIALLFKVFSKLVDTGNTVHPAFLRLSLAWGCPIRNEPSRQRGGFNAVFLRKSAKSAKNLGFTVIFVTLRLFVCDKGFRQLGKHASHGNWCNSNHTSHLQRTATQLFYINGKIDRRGIGVGVA